MFENQFDSYKTDLNKCGGHCVSGMSGKDFLQGRPYGGCAILWKNYILLDIKPVALDSSCACAVKFSLKNELFLVCNIYMPVCSSSNEDYVEILNKLKALRIIHDPDYLVIGGDFNVDLNKHSSLQGILQDFLCEQSSKSCHDFNTCDIKHTFESKCNSAKSFIDYCVILCRNTSSRV